MEGIHPLWCSNICQTFGYGEVKYDYKLFCMQNMLIDLLALINKIPVNHCNHICDSTNVIYPLQFQPALYIGFTIEKLHKRMTAISTITKFKILQTIFLPKAPITKLLLINLKPQK